MILVADASALIAIATCDSRFVFAAIFGNTLASSAVDADATAFDKPQSACPQSYLYGKVRAVDMQRFIDLNAFADAGETYALRHYKEVAGEYLLMDDGCGRKVAKINYIRTAGSLGISLQAKYASLGPCVASRIEPIANRPVFLSEVSVQIALALGGETGNEVK